jgi:hypothetical protein
MDSVPFRGAPPAAVIVPVSFGNHVCADVADVVSLTTTSSLASLQSELWLVPLVLGGSPL